MTYRKKLIEVALPLDAINKASANEKKPIRPGHPSAMHVWWARRPLATCRAILFASLVDDPSEHPEQFPTEQTQEQERERLFRLIEALVQWENSNNEEILQKARAEMHKSTGGNLPPVFDPFAGGGSIPLEAQRLGLEAHASDLNPVAVLINKALIEIPPKFAGCAPVNPEVKVTLMERGWHEAQGLADDVRYYIRWMRNEAEQRIGYLYPKVALPKEYGGGEATVIAWLWTRTVICPNPACGARMPLIRSLVLSKKKGKETYVEPLIDYTTTPPSIHFTVNKGRGQPPSGTVNRHGATCIACNTSVSFDHIRAEGKAGRLDAQLLAIVAEGQGGRIYLSPSKEHSAIAKQAKPLNIPETDLPEQALGFRTQTYGITKHSDLFTPRQLVALTTLSDLVLEAKEKVQVHATIAGLPLDYLPRNKGGIGANAYADAIATYLAIAVDRGALYWSSICSWDSVLEKMRNTFARQAIPMIWDYAEANPFSTSSGNFQSAVDWVAETINMAPCQTLGEAKQHDATMAINCKTQSLISTDPPYYDNIGYAVM